jgi:hypothetical protein
MFNIFSKECINYGIFIFILIIIILLTSFSFYYILPNNYDLYDIKIINNLKPIKSINIKIKSDDKYQINKNDFDFDINNILIQIKTKKENYPIKILLNNILKSQNLIIDENTLFKISNDSCINIINEKNELISLDINFYLVEEAL